MSDNQATAESTQEKLRNSMLHSVVEELVSDTRKFFHFANVVNNELPWTKVKEEYETILPSSLFMLEQMYSTVNRDSIIFDVQAVLQELGCEKISSHVMYTAYGYKEVMFGRIFSPTEDINDKNLASSGFSRHLIPAAKKLHVIAKLFSVVDTWPNTKHCDDEAKLKIVTEMVNKLITF